MFSFLTRFIYELSVLKICRTFTSEIKGEEPEYCEAVRMLKFLKFFRAIEDDSIIVNNSIIREFIGGSICMSEISIIGGITADIEGSPWTTDFGDSNPGKIIMSYGGVGRNITENLARMGSSCILCICSGDDFAGRGAVRELESLGVNIDNIRLLGEESTAVYMSILNIFGDMEVAMCNMDVLEKISTEFIDNIAERAKDSKIIGIDTNMNEETLQYTVEKFKGVPLFLDPVSTAKAERAKKIIGSFHTIKPNRMEVKILSGMQIFSEEERNRAGDWFAEQGVERIFITLE